MEKEIKVLYRGRSEILYSIGVITAIVLGIYLISLYSYLLFHSLVEITTIAIGFTLFILAWNARGFLTNDCFKLLGIGYAFIAIIDLFHTLAYKGMNVFPGYGANLPTQLWIAARFLQAATLCAAPIFVRRRINEHVLFGGYFVVVSAIVALVFSGNFPDCYVEGKGLTTFKVISEYAITAMLLVSLILFYKKRTNFNGAVYALILASIACTAVSEISFTAYLSVYGLANMFGHFLKLAAFYLIYRALLVTGLKEPFDLIFRDLKQTEGALRKAHDTLEEKVRERTAELRASEGKYRTLIESANDAVFIHEIKEDGMPGPFIEVNELACRRLGYSREELARMSPMELDDPRYRDRIALAMERLLKDGHAVFETAQIAKDGRSIPVEVSTRVLELKGTRLLFSIARDITEHKRSEEAQQRESALLRCIIDSARDLIYIKDRDSVYIRCNKASEKFIGLSESEQTGKTDFDFFDREKAKVIQKLDRQVLAEGKPLRIEEWVTDRDGDRMLFDSLKAPYYGPDGEVMGLVGISRDITERKRAEEDLRESEARLKMAMDLAKLAQWEYDIESGMFTFDDQFYALYGTTAEREGGTLMSAEDYTRKFIPAEESAVVAEGAAEVLANSSFQLEHRIIRADGEERSIVVCGEAVRDEAGCIVKARGTNQDITERKRAEEALAKSEARFRRLAENARDVIYRMALPDGAYEYMSPAATELFGYEPEEFYASSQLVRKIIHPEWHVYFEAEWRKLLQGEMPPRYEYQIIHKSGEVRWMNQRNILVRDDEGRIVAIEGIVTDITEQKKAEEQIRHLKNYLSNIIDSMPSILVGMDRNEIVTQWNRQAENISGISATEAVGRPITELLPDFSPWIKGMRSEIDRPRPASMEKLLIEKGGERRFYDLMLYPIIANGAEGAVVRIEDATERARIQELMIQTEKMMSVGGLAAGMAHEINNPLGIITQAAQNIERRVSPGLPANRKAAEELGVSLEGIKAYFEKRQIPEFIWSIREASLRTSRIIANMLQFSRCVGTTMQPASLVGIMEQALELAASDYDLKKKYNFRSIEIIRDYAPDMPEVPMVPVEMEQVMLNLLKNAAQAMTLTPPDRRPRITLRLRREERYALIEVEDNGPGMGEEVRRRVFEPFFTTKEPGMGTGLGLSVSYMIVTQNHKGLMEVESKPGKGACFRVRLPLSKESIHG